jgi:error-prone DNA polymerase
MIAEYRMLRFSAELHPLTLLKDVPPDGTVSSHCLPHLRQHSTVRVAGLVTTRQRPGTARGYVFVLMEDEHGPINVIVKPDIYERDRNAVRMEPFLSVRGQLQKDGDTLNVIAHEVNALRVPGTPVRRRGLSKTDQKGPNPFRYLTALRQNPPDIKSWS